MCWLRLKRQCWPRPCTVHAEFVLPQVHHDHTKGLRVAGEQERGHASGGAHKAHKSKLTCRASCSGLLLMVPSPRVSQLQDASMLLWAFKWGFGSDFVYAFAKANACCVELKIAQIARQTTTRRRARVCVYALAIQRWQHNPAPATYTYQYSPGMRWFEIERTCQEGVCLKFAGPCLPLQDSARHVFSSKIVRAMSSAPRALRLNRF